MKGDDFMRYESFYPFAQPGMNGFSNFASSAQMQAPSAVRNFFGNPGNPAPPMQAPNAGGGFLGNLASQIDPNGPAGNLLGNLRHLTGQMPPNNALGGMAQGAQAAAPAGGRAMSYLQTADKFLNTAQQITPMVRQYAPMFQNVPALWKLYRGFSAIPNAATSVAPAVAASATTTTAAAAPSVASTAAATVTTGLSLPRIFQPPF
ncbi:VrrA/YqfQ family protein [Psychrobacillus sp.]|uniref:VrrA/YqfQ family protein n=1 Tax=Psychrobacillus sp. TaxID=1871623 RepID=UPI0028BF2502|nr:VrrA/YqfQ family protein [Psychrobacillus sp.]